MATVNGDTRIGVTVRLPLTVVAKLTLDAVALYGDVGDASDMVVNIISTHYGVAVTTADARVKYDSVAARRAASKTRRETKRNAVKSALAKMVTASVAKQ